MSESVASCLEYFDNEGTQQTRLFIRMIDRFFDCLNVKSPELAQWQRKESRVPYRNAKDEQYKWLTGVFLQYLRDWEQELASIVKKSEQRRMGLSAETLEGIQITELAPKLLSLPGVEYILSEGFTQDPLERYFSKQRHRGGSNENPTACQVPYNASTLIQQRAVYKDIRTMNVQCDDSPIGRVLEPLRKRLRRKC